jgi:hypothetical protein
MSLNWLVLSKCTLLLWASLVVHDTSINKAAIAGMGK